MSTLLRDYANESSARHASISEAAWSSVRATFPRPRTSPERHALRVRAAHLMRLWRPDMRTAKHWWLSRLDVEEMKLAHFDLLRDLLAVNP